MPDRALPAILANQAQPRTSETAEAAALDESHAGADTEEAPDKYDVNTMACTD